MTNCISTNKNFRVSAHSFLNPRTNLTQEELKQMNKECDAIRIQLDSVVAVCDYVFFNYLQSLVYRLFDLNDACKALIPRSKQYGDLVVAKKCADNLIKLCRKSELIEIMPFISCIMPCYSKRYCDDGGVFIDYTCYKYTQTTKEGFNKLRNKIRQCLKSSVPEDRIELCTEVMLGELTCSILNNIMEACNDKLKDEVMAIVRNKYGQTQIGRTDLNFHTVPVKDYSTLDFRLNNIGETLMGSAHISGNIHLEELKDLMRDIADKMLDKKSAITVRELYRASIEDYTNYCIASMIIHFRKHRELDPDVSNILEEFGIDIKGRNALIMELMNSEICYGETDPHEMKLYIDDIKEKEHIDLLRKMLNVGTEEIRDRLVKEWNTIEYEY